mmetsp:Transcript_13868/g.44381  ORF Transcript_13868/g.44381 Transcript_13868/m.44381 type:complete len:262 (-) Transcript_13868:2220-3005(-)
MKTTLAALECVRIMALSSAQCSSCVRGCRRWSRRESPETASKSAAPTAGRITTSACTRMASSSLRSVSYARLALSRAMAELVPATDWHAATTRSLTRSSQASVRRRLKASCRPSASVPDGSTQSSWSVLHRSIVLRCGCPTARGTRRHRCVSSSLSSSPVAASSLWLSERSARSRTRKRNPPHRWPSAGADAVHGKLGAEALLPALAGVGVPGEVLHWCCGVSPSQRWVTSTFLPSTRASAIISQKPTRLCESSCSALSRE